MFGKKSVQKLETIIGNDSTVTGEMNIKGTLRVDGIVEGDIFSDWVIVGETGRIRGNVKSRGVVVGGRVEGNIDATEIVELKGKGQVTGEISTVKLAMSEGAVFDGRSSMKRAGALEESSESKGKIKSLVPTSNAS
ncbi:MAG: bactofilin family protein [Deltaproteobacteria bacterium]